MRIQHNIMAMNAYRNYSNNVSAMQKNLEKLSSGYKINRAGDDAAGLAISEKMRAQITGLESAQKNAKDGISLVQTAEGALTEVHDMLNRMVELATQSANGTYDNANDREQLQKELNQLRTEIDRIADSSNFNGIKLLDGSMSNNVETSPITVETASVEEVEASYHHTKVANGSTAPAVFGLVSTSAVNASSKTVLHADGAAAVAGSFNFSVAHLKVDGVAAASAAKVTIKLSNGAGASTTIAVEGSSGAAMDGKTIASKLATGKGKYITITSSGTMGVVSGTGTITASTSTAGMLVYTASDQGDGTVTYTLTDYISATGTKKTLGGATTLDAMAAADKIAAASAAGVTLNFTVSASEVGGNNGSLVGANLPGRGTISTDTKLATEDTLGNAILDFNPANLKDGMKIIIGAGTATSARATFSVQLLSSSKTNATTTDGDEILNLSAYFTATASGGATLKASQETALKNFVANTITGKASTTGIEAYVDAAGKFHLLEHTAGQGALADTKYDAVKKAMESKDGFNTLIWVGERVEDRADPADAYSVISIDEPDKIFEGNSIKLNIKGEERTYVFTADQAKLTASSASRPANTRYVDLGTKANGGLVAALKDEVAADVRALYGVTASATNVTVTVGSASSTVGDENVDSAGKIVVYLKDQDTSAVNAITATTADVWTGNAGLTLQIGDTADGFNQLNVKINDMHVKALGIDLGSMSIATQSDAIDAIDKIKDAINSVSDMRGTLGATQNRLDHTINNLSVMQENIQDAESTIRDTDVAKEMMEYTKNNILIQSAQAMLAQANQVPQGVLQLLQ